MKIITNLWHKPIQNATIVTRKPVQLYNSFKIRRFNVADEARIIKIYNNNGIYAHPQFISTGQFLKPLLNAMQINTIGDAKNLARSLRGLNISELLVEGSVDLSRNVIERSTLMYHLEKYIDQEQSLYRMVVQKLGFRKCYIDDSRSLVVAQEIGRDPAKERRELAKFILSRISPPENKTIVSVVSPEDAVNYTAHPGEKFAVVAEMADILAVIPEPGTRKPLLDPEVLNKMEMGEKMKLDGHIMYAVIKFKKDYMGIPDADGDLGPIEITRMLTYNLGYMLTKVINPKSGNPFIFPEVLDAMEPQQQIMLGFGKYNPIYEGAKAFLKLNWPEKADMVTPNDILHDHRVYDMVQDFFKRAVRL